MVALFPRANATPTNAITQANNFFGAGKSVTNNWRIDSRVDWAKSEKWTMYGRLTYAEQQGITPRYFGTGGDSGSEGTAPRYHATFGNTWVPSPRMVINVTMGSGRWREETLPVTLVDGVLGTTIGLPASLVSQMDSPHMPQFNISGYATLSNGRILNFPRRTDNIQLNATREMGKHSLKFGASAENSYLNSIDVRSADFAFDRGMTSGPTATVSQRGVGQFGGFAAARHGHRRRRHRRHRRRHGGQQRHHESRSACALGQVLRPVCAGRLARHFESDAELRFALGTAAAAHRALQPL